jgi:transcriptional regulator with XRE-family HTH domain
MKRDSEKGTRPAHDGAEAPGRMFRYFGLCLRNFREISGHSGAYVARKAGIGKSQLSKYELGRELPKFSSFEKILAALELSPLTFFYALAVVERAFANQDGAEAEILLQEPSTGPLFSAQERSAHRALFDQHLHLLEAAIEGRFLARLSIDQEAGL